MRGRRAKIASSSRSSLTRSKCAALLARPLQASGGRETPLELPGELQQVHYVLAGVGELLA